MLGLPSKPESSKTITRGVTYHKDCDISLIDGVPLQELGMKMQVGPCTVCGKDADVQDGGAIDNIRVEEGVIKGDSICLDCVRDQEGHDPDLVAFVEGRL